MDHSHQDRVEALFDEASALRAHARQAFLDRACGDDVDLRRELESLLAAEGQADEYIARVFAGAARALAEEGVLSRVERIGPYRVDGELGRGGMGQVYLAVRADDEYRKEVAIKLIRQGADDHELRGRFLHERQILANLEHPYIARLLDGGTTDDGTPYVVLERVDGEPIDEYCDRRRLNTVQRLRLFRQVCDAVQYAHANLVVHRDIKPGNILVNERGEPRLLDFGIAKLLDAPSGAPATRTAARLMTPEYASPEQVRGQPITTASDIYSLGVLLYALLSGRLPYELDRSTPSELERVICEAQPGPPSAAVMAGATPAGNSGEGPSARTPDSVASARGVSPERLRRQLAGDLDNIVLMALRKEPDRRYASAQQFSEDIRRHLEGLPVAAHRDTLAYRGAKFVKRHRAGIAAAVAAVTLIAGITGFYLVRLTSYSVRLAEERDRARLEAEKAEEVAAFLTGLFEVSDPGESRGRDVRARELLDRGAERVERELAEQPGVQATMMGVIGGVYQQLGLYEEALPLLEDALDIRRRFFESGSLETAQSMASLGSLLSASGDYDRADSLLTAALELRRDRLPAGHPDVLKSINHLADLRVSQGQLPSAESLYVEALSADAEPMGESREIRATLLSNLGLLLKNLDRLDEAEARIREALAIRRELHGEQHPDVGATLNHLGLVLRFRGEYDAAEAIFRDLVAWGPRVLGERHPTYATWLNNLAVILKDKGEYAAAETIQRQVLAIYLERYGEEHSQVALAFNNLANLRHDQGDFEEAEQLHLRSLRINRALFGDEHPEVATSLYNLASLLGDKGDYGKAVEYQRRVLELDRKLLGSEHEYVAGDLNSLGTYLMESGAVDQAEPPLREAYGMATRLHGNDHPSAANSAYGLADLLVRTGRAAEAEALARQAVRVRRATLTATHWSTGLARTLLGEVLARLGRFEEAEAELLPGYSVLRENRPEGDRHRQKGYQRLVALYRGWGRPDQAAAVPR